MPHKTFAEQVAEHLHFLHTADLAVTELIIDSANPIRCLAIGETAGRGEYAYTTKKNPMQNGLVGLSTWCRGPRGAQTFRTYGQDGDCKGYRLDPPKKEDPISGQPSSSGNKARFLWDQCAETGRSPYLERKGVGTHGIRFLENQYGCVAVVPCHDATKTIQGLQFINPNGSKRFLKGVSTEGLFHMLAEPINGELVGLAESYSTAATCYELTGVPTVCAFSCGNLSAVTQTILNLFPASHIVIFADNDRHLEHSGKPNQGVLMARQAQKGVETRVSLAVPDFGDCAPAKEATDWNDLVCIKGVEAAREQIAKCLSI
jgi:hypothetical protein